MNVQRVFGHLEYVGKALGKRQEYFVFSPKKRSHFLMFTRNGKVGGNYSVVSSEAVDKVALVFKGSKGVTASSVGANKATRKISKVKFAPLGCLYILVAQDRATVDRRRKGRAIFFNVR